MLKLDTLKCKHEYVAQIEQLAFYFCHEALSTKVCTADYFSFLSCCTLLVFFSYSLHFTCEMKI